MKVAYKLFCFFILALPIQAKTIHFGEKQSIAEVFKYTNATYVIDKSLDLSGKTLQLPQNSTLSFSRHGMLRNGKVIGNHSVIKADARQILDNVSLFGTWENTKVYSQWFQLHGGSASNNDIFSNLMLLCSGNKLTHFYMQKGTYYVSAVYRSAPILIPSNVYWHNEATIKMLPTDLEWYNIIYMHNSYNITIDGGAFIGDVGEHKGNTGEWGHGIKCGGATNVIIKNVVCSHCWGDGIDLIEGLDEKKRPENNCNRITIDNVKCLYNRRQGISIEAASNVKITNSEFAYTGSLEYTKPGAGLDIEPWTNNKDKVWNISIEHCHFHNNKGFDVQCEPNVEKKNLFTQLHNNINFSKCEIGVMRIQYAKGIALNNCNVNEFLSVLWADDVVLKDTKIEEYKKGKGASNIKIKNCQIGSSLLSYTIPFFGISALALTGITLYKKFIA